MSADRVAVGTVSRSNGAYLIELNDGHLTIGIEAWRLFDAASSLASAKRLLRENAESIGYTGPFRWSDDGHTWRLSAPDIDLPSYNEDTETWEES